MQNEGAGILYCLRLQRLTGSGSELRLCDKRSEYDWWLSEYSESVGLLRETRHHDYPDEAGFSETYDCVYADQASKGLKDTFYILVARTNMGTVLSYAYMHWRIKAQEVRADQ
jgi:hypothetical protein